MPDVSLKPLNQQIDRTMARLKKELLLFDKKERGKITRKAAQPIARAAKKATPRSKRAHYRYKKGGKRIKYNPGNLSRSNKVLRLKRTRDAYVGPEFNRRSQASEFGGVGQPTDGYYAAMAFGSSKAYRRKVLDVAAREGGPKAFRILERESKKAIKSRFRRAGFSTN